MKTSLREKVRCRLGLAAQAIFFAAAVCTAFFIFTGRASAQDFSGYDVPHAVCQAYRGQAGYSIVRDVATDCLVRSGDAEMGFIYPHAFISGNKFCFEMTGSKMGTIMAVQCHVISQIPTQPLPNQPVPNQPQKTTVPKLVTPVSFQLKELQYDTLPHGKPIKSGDNERIELQMPDGSKIQIDANSTFTPVSDYEVQSVFGRYRYMWQPFHDGKCIVGQALARQECRKVKTRDAVLGITGTEFLVDTDKAGTTVTVIDGSLLVSDLNYKKSVQVEGGQATYIKHGGLPTDPQPYDSATIDHWWEKKTPEQIDQDAMNFAIGFGVVFFIIILIVKRKQIFQKKPPPAPVHDAKPAPGLKPGQTALLILIIIIIAVAAYYFL
jgi:hypothetical protein